jgi:hypothetical protein
VEGGRTHHPSGRQWKSVHTLSSEDWILIQEGTLQYKALHFSSLAQVVRPRHFAIRHMLAAIFHYAS